MTIHDLRTTIESSLPAWTVLVPVIVGVILIILAWSIGNGKK